jgi:hypothetical protein
MSGGQVAALVCAILLLLPGGCFLLVGINEANRYRSRQYTEWFDNYLVMLPVAVAILSVAGLLFWLAFRRRHGRGGPTAPPI